MIRFYELDFIQANIEKMILDKYDNDPVDSFHRWEEDVFFF